MIGHRMRRVTAVVVASIVLAVGSSLSSAQAPEVARQRQAAAQAYDKGTTAYVDQAYEEAASWFETANRLAPAAAALMQAIRAHEKSNNVARAATLALELEDTYPEDPTATSFAQSIVDKHQSALVRVRVTCEEKCELDLDGKVEERMAFFVTPGTPHQLVASFDRGAQASDVTGAAGETKELTFGAPPPPSTPVAKAGGSWRDPSVKDSGSRPPLSPVVTWIGLGVTVALGAATIYSGIDAVNHVPEYKRATTALDECKAARTLDCQAQSAAATRLLEKGRGRETRTNILIGVTAGAAVGTGVLAFLFTDWSGDRDRHDDTHDTHTQRAASRSWFAGLYVAPVAGGATTVLEGRF